MTQDTTYNGWSNPETWCVNLWLNNEQATQEHINAMISDERCFVDSDEWNPRYPSQTRAEYLLHSIADAIEALVDDGNALDAEASLYTDLLRGALNRVDYREIAKGFLEE